MCSVGVLDLLDGISLLACCIARSFEKGGKRA